MSRVLQLDRGKLVLSGALLVIGIAAAVFFLRGSAVADVMTWTSDADFDVGASQGVNHDDPNHDQLQLDETGTTFPLMWIANAGEDTLSMVHMHHIFVRDMVSMRRRRWSTALRSLVKGRF